MEYYLRSLRRVAEELGFAPGVDDYREVSAALRAAGEDVASFNTLYRYFDRSWPRVREALDLSETNSARKLEWRFNNRKTGKTWRYTHDTLRDVLRQAAEHWGRPPSVAEFEWWRERQLALGRSTGSEHFHLPSSTPYRRRWGTWEAALLHFGYTPEEVAERLEQTPRAFFPDAGLPDGLPVADVPGRYPEAIPLSRAEYQLLRRAWDDLPRRSRYVLTVRLGLGLPAITLRESAAPLRCHLSSVHNIQNAAINALAEAVGFKKGRDLTEVVLAVRETLERSARLPESVADTSAQSAQH